MFPLLLHFDWTGIKNKLSINFGVRLIRAILIRAIHLDNRPYLRTFLGTCCTRACSFAICLAQKFIGISLTATINEFFTRLCIMVIIPSLL